MRAKPALLGPSQRVGNKERRGYEDHYRNVYKSIRSCPEKTRGRHDARSIASYDAVIRYPAPAEPLRPLPSLRGVHGFVEPAKILRAAPLDPAGDQFEDLIRMQLAKRPLKGTEAVRSSLDD